MSTNLNQAVFSVTGVNNSISFLSDLPASQFNATPYNIFLASSASQSLDDGTTTNVTFDTVNGAVNFSTAAFDTANADIVVPAGGVWLVSCAMAFDASNAGFRFVGFTVNGGYVQAALQVLNVGGSSTQSVATSGLALLAAGDTVNVVALQSSGGALNIGSSFSDAPTTVSLIRLSM